MVWYLAQLFPRTYWTTYADSAGDHFTIWKMWLGRSYSVNDIVFQSVQPEAVAINVAAADLMTSTDLSAAIDRGIKRGMRNFRL